MVHGWCLMHCNITEHFRIKNDSVKSPSNAQKCSPHAEVGDTSEGTS